MLGQIRDIKNKTDTLRSRTSENIAAVSVEENQSLSIFRRFLKLITPQTSSNEI